MEIRNLITFLAVVEHKNFTKAAESLSYSQSAVTVQIKQLEKELGIELFNRIGKSVSLTEYGEEFRIYAGAAVEAIKRAEAFHADSLNYCGKIRFGVVGTILSAVLIEIIEEYQKVYPNVSISVTEASSAELERKIRKCELDIAYFLDYKTPSNEWIRVREEKENFLLVTNPNNPICKKKKVPFPDIAEQRLILMPKGENYRTLFDDELVRHNLTASPVLELVNTDMITRLLMKDNYVSLLPEFSVRKYLKDGRLAKINVNDMDLYQYSQLAYLKGKSIPPHLQSFIDMILEKC